ncbi:MAG TPA: hypothetical protein VFA89_04905 [Terriglobales bacterium]|nr:hypothetical protein [Terriglobales bacterium]
MRQLAQNAKVLNSWKEIAGYLGRGVRTVQRWESNLGLPVRRVAVSERSPVFAFVSDLDFWLHTHAAHIQLSAVTSPQGDKEERDYSQNPSARQIRLRHSLDLVHDLVTQANRHLVQTERLLSNLRSLRLLSQTPGETIHLQVPLAANPELDNPKERRAWVKLGGTLQRIIH